MSVLALPKESISEVKALTSSASFVSRLEWAESRRTCLTTKSLVNDLPDPVMPLRER